MATRLVTHVSHACDGVFLSCAAPTSASRVLAGNRFFGSSPRNSFYPIPRNNENWEIIDDDNTKASSPVVEF